MIQHEFIFHPGYWIGEGRIVFSASPEFLHFYTRWKIGPAETTGIHCSQEVEMVGAEIRQKNALLLTAVTPTSFIVDLENETFGKTIGKGVIDEKPLLGNTTSKVLWKDSKCMSCKIMATICSMQNTHRPISFARLSMEGFGKKRLLYSPNRFGLGMTPGGREDMPSIC